MRAREFIIESRQGMAEGSPNFNREWDEATRYPEFVNLGKEKWIELVSKGKPVTVTRKNVNKINNTDAADPKSFKLLDPEKQKRALAQLANGDVEMPIVARYSDGYLELIGGNTRLTAQMAKDGQAKVWLFNVPEELTQGVAEDSLNEFLDDRDGDDGEGISQIVTITDRLLKQGYRVDLAVIGAMGRVYRADLDQTGFTPNGALAIKRKTRTFLRPFAIDDDDLYEFELVAPKHYKIVDSFTRSDEQGVAENFADGKKPGRKGLAKRSGVNCKASVSTLRRVAKNSSGEKQRMAHWCANMKSGRKK